MTVHTLLKNFVDNYGVGQFSSPYLPSIIDDECIFRPFENRSFKSIFKKMFDKGDISRLVAEWSYATPGISSYAPAYTPESLPDVQYIIDCIGFAMGKIDELSAASSVPGEINQRVDLNSETVEYISHGSNDNLGMLIPSVMAQPVHRHLNAITREEGSVAQYVAAELGEPDVAFIRSKISGEQIDGVALAIRQMSAGRAFILGDMTGVGKGRQLAMLLKWARRKGFTPVFITEKSMLFNDLYRDLKDVGYDDMRPFILNSDPGARITDRFGHIVYNLPSEADMEELKETGSLPYCYDFLLTTYSQLNKDFTKSWKPGAVLQVIKDSYLIMDESHYASGLNSNVGVFSRSAVQAARGVCFASATYAKYPSSMPLYALRTAIGDANIPAEELLKIVSQGGPILQEVMSRGLVESGSMIRRQRDMSEVERTIETPADPCVAEGLCSAYDKVIALIDDIRDFHVRFIKPYVQSLDPVDILNKNCKKSHGEKWIDKKCLVADWSPQQRLAPTIRQLLFSLKTDLAIEHTLTELRAGRKPIVQVSRTMASNIARLLEIGDSCDAPDFVRVLESCVADMFQYQAKGITERKTGYSTRETAYSCNCRYDFAEVIKFYESDEWKKICPDKNPDETAKQAADGYNLLLDEIRTTLTGLPLSPIDYFSQRLIAEGYAVGELTQRCLYMEYDDVMAGPDSKAVCKARKAVDKKQIAADFNNGKIDVLIGNRVMASGISLHSSEAFADARPRTIITWEMQESADLQTQFDGRADRTGQIHRCKYKVLVSPVPAEQRYMMMSNRKQRSLNANVEASQGGRFEEDMFNKYGARVICEYAADNPEFAETVLSAELTTQGSDRFKSDKKVRIVQGNSAEFVSRFLRDLGLLSCADQVAVMTDVTERYNLFIESLEENGENDLRTDVLPLKAVMLEQRILVDGRKGNMSAFSQAAKIEKLEVDVLRKPLTAEQITETMAGLKDAKWLKPKVNDAVKEKTKNIEDYYATLRLRAQKQLGALISSGHYTPSRIKLLEERANNKAKMHTEISKVEATASAFADLLDSFVPGEVYAVPATMIPDGATDDPMLVRDMPVGIFMGYKVIGDKYTASRVQAVFAVNDSRSIVRVAMSDKDRVQTIVRQTYLGVMRPRLLSYSLATWNSRIVNFNREIVYMVTGNILAGIVKCNKCKKTVTRSKLSRFVAAMAQGRMVKYTDKGGNINCGYMLARSFNMDIFFKNIII